MEVQALTMPPSSSLQVSLSILLAMQCPGVAFARPLFLCSVLDVVLSWVGLLRPPNENVNIKYHSCR